MKCWICIDSREVYTSWTAFKCHFKLIHPNVQPKRFECKEADCARFFSTHKSLLKHLRVDHRDRVVHRDRVAEIETAPSAPIPLDEENSCDNVFDGSEIGCDNTQKSNDFCSAIRTQIDTFVAKLYGNPKIPRSYVQSIIDDVNQIFCVNLVGHVKDSVNKTLRDCGASDEQKSDINAEFQLIQESFAHMSSDYLRLKYFMESGNYIPPQPYEIGEEDVAKPSINGSLLKKKKVYGQYIPLDKVFVKYFELPDSLSSILTYIDFLKNNDSCIENYMQCRHWKAKVSKYKCDDIVLPLHVYYDDFQCNNSLGSHAEKLGAVYVSLPCLPPECQGTVDNIFLALLFHTSYRSYGDDKVFAPLIKLLIFLEEEGILIETAEGMKRIYFVTGLLLGDNLGANSLGGFVECFTATYFCRFCKTPRSQTLTQAVEDRSLLRDELFYNDDVALENPTLTGIKKSCILNALPSFHITSNYSVDLFHDIAEGCCHYVMLHVLGHCVPKYFSVEDLNNRIRLFDYGKCESNRIPLLSHDFISKTKLKMTGSETTLFVKLFGLLIGDRVPQADPYWRLYLKLRDLMDSCFCRVIYSNSSIKLRVLVEEFNKMYVSVTKDTLKAKFHNLVHYATILDESGPLELASTKRYESKHRTLLIPAHATMSRKQITLTVAIKHQLNMCYRFMSKQSILKTVEAGPGDYLDLYSLKKFVCLKKHLPDPILSAASACFSPNWVNVKGTTYKPGMVLLTDVSDLGPVFGKIEFILMAGDSVAFVITYLLNLGFDQHVHAFEIDFSNLWSCIQLDEVFDPLPLYIHRSINGDKYAVLRHEL